MSSDEHPHRSEPTTVPYFRLCVCGGVSLGCADSQRLITLIPNREHGEREAAVPPPHKAGHPHRECECHWHEKLIY